MQNKLKLDIHCLSEKEIKAISSFGEIIPKLLISGAAGINARLGLCRG